MSATPSRAAAAAKTALQKPKAQGFLNIVRHGAGPSALYVVTYHRLDRKGAVPRPALAEGARALIELLERIGIDFHLAEVREALEDVLRLGSANIPDLWLTDDEILEKGLADA
jgi:hypothetical protein